MSNQGDIEQISGLFDNLRGKLDKMSNNIEIISGSLVNLTDEINEAMTHVSDNLETIIEVFEKTFQFSQLSSSNITIERIADKIKDKFDIDEFQENLEELNQLISTLRELKEEEPDDESTDKEKDRIEGINSKEKKGE
ncbi:MAG: hypothetical protein GF329_07620 [Candidatus Lokiarchaeota archaeon]|nr:hypothetical protein [Candidatus Lokiarchaeota archaeon]